MLTTHANEACDSQRVVEMLGRCASYPEGTNRVERVETHISWVFLTDRHAYKLKKPVRYDFLDFSTVDLRRKACEQEVHLNRRLAPDTYLGVVPITSGRLGRLRLGGTGAAVDWVVKMRRLPAEHTLDSLIRRGELGDRDITQLAETLAEFYLRLPPLNVNVDEYRRQIESHVQANRHELLSGEHHLPISLIEQLHERQVRLLRLVPDLLDNRVRDGRIVEGHGDLRPEHIYFNSHTTIIDCIEFNAELRSLDVLDELAFLAMECDLQGAESVGNRVIDYYQRTNADNAPRALLEFYKLYRACVRAKVLALRSMQVESRIGLSMLQQAEKYLHLSTKYSNAIGPPLLIVVRGLPGSGKSTLAGAIVEALNVELLQTDAVRREMFGQPSTNADYDQQQYNPEARTQVYEEMFRRARVLLDANRSVVLDGTFLSNEQRRTAIGLAQQYEAEPLVVHCTCPKVVALGRIGARMKAGTSLSDARPDFFDLQQQADEPDTMESLGLTVDTTESLPEIQQKVLTRLRDSAVLT